MSERRELLPLARALDELLDTARLSTIEKWCRFASDVRVQSLIFALAQAETMFRKSLGLFRELGAISKTKWVQERLDAIAKSGETSP